MARKHRGTWRKPCPSEQVASRLERLTPGEDASGIHWLTGPQSRSGRGGKQEISIPTGNQNRVVQPTLYESQETEGPYAEQEELLTIWQQRNSNWSKSASAPSQQHLYHPHGGCTI
jgi:hypothetical protein